MGPSARMVTKAPVSSTGLFDSVGSSFWSFGDGLFDFVALGLRLFSGEVFDIPGSRGWRRHGPATLGTAAQRILTGKSGEAHRDLFNSDAGAIDPAR